ncbi:hypothetical protein GCM10011581_40290 [Saccharopolyspora subtropica]|uniref:ATP-grasp domain-containing protein n=1 Tax=Saccharopolyspora thermophila TaxID=89367 RepID=A0A917K2X8_9PSEU|nr:ATP-grasp domain-containing protein [Saccharopolyspora subtropica]GGI98981.1 hypothetical protein GCM10011581_40290 [Saccharopolyspora subtropica]
MRKNVFVLGLDDHNRRLLLGLPDVHQYRFHPVLGIHELQLRENIPVMRLLDEAQRVIQSSGWPADAIVGYWDFPVTSMVPILCRRMGLTNHAPLAAVVKCEHKYWCRLEQRKVIDEWPRFGLVDPERDTAPPAGVRFPLWLKPVKSFSGMLAYRCGDQAEFSAALEAVRRRIHRVGDAFEAVLSHVDLPPEVAGIGGQMCIVEEALRGRQVTVEGYCYRGQPDVYGIVDSVTSGDTPSFLRYQYPSTLPGAVGDRMISAAERVVRHLGLVNSAFNVEFFWDHDTDEIGLLEVNPRHSQSHAALFQHVDGVTNHHCMLQLAFGRRPRMPHRRGRYQVAAKWFLRHFTDGVVVRHPTPEETAAVQRAVPGTSIDLIAHEHDRLSELYDQDSYSYNLANIYIGAADEAELIDKFQRCAASLHYEIDETPIPEQRRTPVRDAHRLTASPARGESVP